MRTYNSSTSKYERPAAFFSAIRSRSPRSPVTKLLLERSPRSSSEASSAAPSEEIWPPDSPGEKLPIISPWRKVMMPEAVSSFNFERNFLASSLLFFSIPSFLSPCLSLAKNRRLYPTARFHRPSLSNTHLYLMLKS